MAPRIRHLSWLTTLVACFSLASAVVPPALAQITAQGHTTAASGHLSVIQGGAYAARHDVYFTAYESPNGIMGRFVNSAGATVGDPFAVATRPNQAIVYANKPVVAYSTDTADDVFFVMYGSDYNKSPDAQPSVWIQRVSFTGTGGARVGNPIQVGDGGWEVPNDIVYNPATRQFVAVWERFFSEGPDVMVRFFNADGTAGSGIVNVSAGNYSQGAAKAAVDWERNRILVAYQGVHPSSSPSVEVLGLWAKVVDGGTGAVVTPLLQTQAGLTIEAVPVFLPEADGFLVAWTGFNPGRDVQGRFVSSADGSVGAMPGSVYTVAGTGRQEGAAMGMYDAISRRVLMAIQSSGACPSDTCPYLDGAVLSAQGAVQSVFTGLSTAAPSATGGTFYPDVAVGEGGQLGITYTLNYASVHVERVLLPAADTPGPTFGGGGPPPAGLTASPASLAFAVTKNGATLGAVSAQTVSLSFSGSSGSWSVTASQPWVQVTGGSGSGNGSFTVTIVNPSDVIGVQTSLNANLTVTAPAASNSPITIPVSLSVSSGSSGGSLTQQGNTTAASGHLSVLHGLAYAARHDVYFTAYESPNGIMGRFVNSAGATVGDPFAVATRPSQAIVYANKPVVAYSTDTADDVFFVMYGSDYNKSPDAQPSVWIQRVSFTGTGGARVGNPIQVGDGGWEVANDIVYNPATRQFVAVWERFFSEGPDVMVRFFNADGTAGSGIVNVSAGNYSQGAAKAAVDWERNRILVAYQGVHPSSSPSVEVLGLWAKVVDGGTGAVVTPLLQTQAGLTIEAVPVFLPEADGFLVAWTGFNPGRDVQGRFVSSADGSVGAMPGSVYTVAGTGRQEGAAMGMYDAISRRVLMAIQSSGACPSDTCPYLDGAVLSAQGAVQSVFTGLSTAAPSATGGTFYPDVAVGEGGQFGISYTLNYASVHVERVVIGAADTPGPTFGGSTPLVGINLSTPQLSFSIQKSGVQLTGVSPETVTLAFSSGTAGAWTATSSHPWLRVTGGSGSGNGSFTVTVVNPGNIIASQTSLAGTITVTAPTAPNSPVSLPVSVTISYPGPVTTVPIGSFDSPIPGSTVSGSIGVTGWALDDVGINRVEIWRDRIDGDPAPPFVSTGHPANGKVFVANGTFVEGTRLDIATTYTDYPAANRSGWGYLLLTQGLPGGNGTFVLTAIAWDQEGQSRVLGTKTITVNNAAAIKPFGTIDVPAYGGTFSGHNFTFGWALTPALGCSISGGTKIMTIDSLPASTPTGFGIVYGAPRTDIAAAFPGFLDSAAAGGAAAFDSRSYANGTYQIGWLVYDSCNNGEGLGSRFFSISNPTPGDAPVARTGTDTPLGPADPVGLIRGRGPTFSRVGEPVGLARAADRALDHLWLVRGLGEMERPVADGARVRLSQTGRIELHVTRPGGVPLPGVTYAGYLVVDGRRQSLPLGSSFDARTGSFYWQPVAGFLGTYELRIEQLRGEIAEAVWHVPVEVSPEPSDAALMHVDEARCHGGRCVIQGWALDPLSSDGAGMGLVHVWATSSVTATPVFVGEAALGGARPDVAERYGRQFTQAGYTLDAALPPGEWTLTVYGWNIRTASWDAVRQVTVTGGR